MQITVLVALYNGIEFLEEALKSVKKQTYHLWTCKIGVNGHGPTGGEVLQTAQTIVQRLQDPRFQVLNLPDVRGVCQADNRLLDLAPTEWIAHLDADDVWHPEKLQKQVEIVQQAKKQGTVLDCIGTDAEYIGEWQGKPILPKGLLTEASFFRQNPIIHSSMLVKKSKIRYPEMNNGTQDYAAFLEMVGRGSQFYVLDQPLTYHRVYAQSSFNASGKQDPRQVVARFWRQEPPKNPATVVSAFYEMPSKFSFDMYVHWTRMFLGRCPCHLILFTEEKHKPLFEDIRKDYMDRTQIIVLPREEWIANQKWGSHMWEEEYKKDFEKNHSPDLYKVWYEKKEFVKRAIRLNPFGHTKFVWCDVGICRTDETMLWMMNFANGDRISEDRMMLLQIDEFKPADYEVQADGLKGAFLQENRVGGGIQAASAQTWLTWSDKYDAMMQRYLEAKRFVGKDQHIMASVCVEYPDLVQCIQPPEGRYRDPRQMWFYLALYLGANSERFAMITS